jgi:ABC-type multidrug transport system ATPase subunit
MSSEVRPPIETRAFAKQFGSVRALYGMDLTVHAGEVHGFLGPNGAGKTTTLRILRVERATWWPSEGALQAPATPRSDPAARRSALGRVVVAAGRRSNHY